MEESTPPANVNSDAKLAIANKDAALQETRLTISQTIEKRAKELYSDAKAQEFVAALVTASEKTPKIKQCSSTSIITAMMACVMLDLPPNTGQQYAYLIPYGSTLQFQLGYQGLIELAYRSGMISSISAELVFPEDTFEVSLGSERKITHSPNYSIDRTKYENVTHVYATARLSNGDFVFDVMNKEELKKISDTAKSSSTDAPWRTWPESMAKKTVIKRLLKYLPKSTSDNRLQLAAQWDSLAEVGKLTYKNGEIVEGSQIIEDKKQPSKEIRNFSQNLRQS